MSNSLDPGQARHIVGPDLGPNCLQKLTADDTNRYIVKTPFTLTMLKYFMYFNPQFKFNFQGSSYYHIL